MSIICPTVLASEPHEFRGQVERLMPFAERIQIDLADGEFAPTRTINPIQVYLPEVTTDIHLMFVRPQEHTETLVSLRPHMVIIHAEAQGDLAGLMQHFKKFGIKAGVCLLKDTAVDQAEELVAAADHVLLFSGSLGRFGGQADLRVLDKVARVRDINGTAEIGWDGGANLGNVRQLAAGGIDIINVGGFIQGSQEPEIAYQKLVNEISG